MGFQITMTLGRFLGDGISDKIGSVKIVTLGAVFAILGYFLVLSADITLSIIGFTLNGLGFSVMVPEVFRIGGNVKGIESSKGIAFIAGTGYAGFLCAPPILGFLAENYSLTRSFVVLLVCAFLILLFTLLLKRKTA